MAGRFSHSLSMTSGSSTFFQGASKLPFGEKSSINCLFEQSNRILYRGQFESNTLLIASTSCRTTHESPTPKASVSTLTLEEKIPTTGVRLPEFNWSASASSAQQWLKQPPEVESFFSNFQPANRFHSSSLPQLPTTRSTGGIEKIEVLISRCLPNLPKPLSINCLAGSKTKRSTTMRVAHPGAAGAHSQSAAAKAFPDCELVPCGKFEIPFEAVELGLADRAVLPIENSVGGSVHKNYDLLLSHRLSVVGEVHLPVRHCLLALPGKAKGDLKRVLSHPQALSQCEHNLSRLGVTAEAVNDTATAAQLVANNGLQDTGAISSSAAANLYGLDILDNDFQDYSGNTTRFLIAAREPLISGAELKSKTSIVFALENDCDDLFRALSVFALRNINLTKIESRPQSRKALKVVDRNSMCMTERLLEYLFYVDFEASMADRHAQNALKDLEEIATFLRLLGSYPIEDPSCS